jgi:hypothetical protein
MEEGMKRGLLITLALIAVLFLAGFTLQVSKQQWEYKAVGSPKDLNKLGDEGWELVAIDSDGHVFYLKRAK